MSKNTNETLYSTEKMHQIDENKILDDAISSLKGTAIKFATDVIKDAKIRDNYTKNITRVATEVKAKVNANEITAKEGAKFCEI